MANPAPSLFWRWSGKRCIQRAAKRVECWKATSSRSSLPDSPHPDVPRAGPPADRAKLPKRLTCRSHDRTYSDEQREFLVAIQRYKEQHRRPHPTWEEVLEVLLALGYRKAEPAPSCAECRYFKAGEVPTCHRRPPVLVTPSCEEDTGPQYAFPPTAPDEWCGEYESRINLPTTRAG